MIHRFRSIWLVLFSTLMCSAQSIWVDYTNNSYYVSAPWTNSSRWEFEIQVTNTSQLTGDHRYKAITVRPNTNVTDHTTAGTALGSVGDDLAPLNLLSGYVSGDHGWLINKVTWPTHSAVIGNQLKDAGGHLYAVTEIVDADKFWIAPNNATGSYFSMTAGNLTNVTQNTSISAGSWSYSQDMKFPSCLSSTNSFQLDRRGLSLNSTTDGTVFEATVQQTIFDVRSAYAAALGNPAFTYASLSPLLIRTLTTRVYGNCQLTITDAIQSLAATNWTVGYFGGMQCAPKSASTYYWFPNSKAIAGVDLSVPVACTEVNSTTYWTNNAQCATDTSLGLNVFWTFDDVTVGASTNFSTGQVLLYDPVYGNSAASTRNAATKPIWQVNGGTQKLYPENLVGSSMASNDVVTIKSYRRWFPTTGTFYNNVQIQRDYDSLSVTGAVCNPFYSASLAYASAPIDNPLKGLTANTSHSVSSKTKFPHSLVYGGFPLRNTVVASNTYDWTEFDYYLNATTNDGSQLIPRFFMDYPGWTNSPIPQYLLDGGLQTWDCVDSGHHHLFPNYEDTNLQSCLTNFIAAYGARYDGDPRIAFVQVGTLGIYGEWHYGTSANAAYWASTNCQKLIQDAYTNAFKHTLLQMRYPAGTNAPFDSDPKYNCGGEINARNDNYPFGFYDDSFGETTLTTNQYDPETLRPHIDNSWYQWPEMRLAGTTNNWKRWPNGGEVSMATTQFWMTNSQIFPGQGWWSCVSTTHSSYCHFLSAFYTNQVHIGREHDAALIGAYQLGYELWAKSYSASGNTVQVTITNTGVAPFYYPWQVKIGAVTNGVLAKSWDVNWDIRTVIPGDGDVTFSATLSSPPTVPYTLLMRAVQPLEGGRQLHFANVNEGLTLTNWLTLGPGGSPYRVSNLRVSTIRGK